MSSLRGAAGLGAVAALALTSGCGMLGLGAEEKQSDEERLIAMLNESRRIEQDLADAEFRIVQRCLEDQGFTVHDPWMSFGYEDREVKTLVEYLPHEEFLLDPEEAAEYGFGQWASGPASEDDPAAQDYWKDMEDKWSEEEEEMGWEEPDTSDWDALTPDEQYDWYVAYQGEEFTEHSQGTREDYASMFSEDPMEFTDEEIIEVEGEEDGSLEIQGGYESVQPKPGGCQIEMIEALYGEPVLKEETWQEDGESGSYSYWTYRPENPMWSGEENMWEEIEATIAQGMSDLQYEFIDCVEEKGHLGWEFNEGGSLPIWEFFAALYYQDAEDAEMWWGESDVEVPEIPEAAGTAYVEWKAYEIQLATDFSACGETTDYAATAEKVSTEAYVEFYSGYEQDVYAWQESMNESLTKAQGLLE